MNPGDGVRGPFSENSENEPLTPSLGLRIKDAHYFNGMKTLE